MDRGAGQAVVLGVAKSWTRLSTPHTAKAIAPGTFFLFFILAVLGLQQHRGFTAPAYGILVP